ncbi:MAG: response regulator [Opitutales bacterium]|nr:response regulator [Opitutales bacterium]
MNRLNISARLLVGFGIVLVLVMLLGVVGYRGISRIWEDSERMYKHPFAVSNAVREIQTRIYAMHRSMKDVSLANNELELESAIRLVNRYETEAFKEFELVQERFLGDPEQILNCREKFKNWRPIRQDVIDLTREGKKDEAVAITKGRGAKYIEELLESIEDLKAFANNKAFDFHKHSNLEHQSSKVWMLTIFTIALVLAFLIALIITLSIRNPINSIVEHVKGISLGDVRTKGHIMGTDEIAALGCRLNSMQENLLAKLKIAEKVTRGDYSAKVEEQSDRDELAMALNLMTETLSGLSETNERETWLKNGTKEMDDLMRGDKEMVALARDVLGGLSKYLGAQMGVVYKYEKESEELNLLASFAYTPRKGLSDKFKLGEGLVGQAAIEKKTISVSEVPEGYHAIVSGLGSSPPKHLVIVPLVLNDELIAVMEFSFLQKINEQMFALLDEVVNPIAIALSSAESRNVVNHLLHETQQKTAELENQKEELRATNEELENHTKRLRESEAQLQMQQEELATTNEELEEKNEYLEKQKTEIDRKNRFLEKAQKDLEAKAEQLEITSRYKSEFLANMSHELRTPLNSLLILSKDLMDNTTGNLDEEQIESASIIHKGGNDLLHLINDILDLSKIEAGKLAMHFEPMNLDSCFDSLIRRFSPLAKEKGISLSILRSDDLPESIVTDSQRIIQILTNLLSNAVKFTQEGKVELMAGRSPKNNNMLRLQVIDTGIGIPEKKQAEIFEAFQQVDGGISRRFGGSGLGLSITRELCKLMNIEISVQSVENKGSTFTLLVPVEEVVELSETEEEGSKKNEVVESEKTPQVPKTIADDLKSLSEGDRSLLVIEDDTDFARTLKRLSRKRGFKFIHATSGELGLELAEKHAPSAVILDIHLPGIQGWEVLDRLKENDKTRHIPIHMISADSHSIEALKKGAIGFLQKPVDSDQLTDSFSKIESFIEKGIKELLIVEDDKEAQESLTRLIRNEGISISIAEDGKTALKQMKSKSFDCIILDVGLPDMSGIDLLKILKNENGVDLPPIVIHTGQEISKEMEFELQNYSKSIIIKGVRSSERLLDETALFLHQVIEELPSEKREMIQKLHDSDSILEGKKVLLVDDDMRNVFALSKLLAGKNMEVIKAANGQKAIEALEENPDLDMILMDVMMPVMDGLEATRRIREMKEHVKLPIICVTAKAMKEDRQKCIDAGANDYITKPVDTDRLFSVMRVWLYQ